MKVGTTGGGFNCEHTLALHRDGYIAKVPKITTFGILAKSQDYTNFIMTEKEIKDINPRYFEFAEELEK